MGELFDRSVVVTINTFKLVLLDAAFKIEKTIKPEPNTCDLSIWNLSEGQRSELEMLLTAARLRAKSALTGTGLTDAKLKEEVAKRLTGIPVDIAAGYGGDNTLIWSGDLRTAKSAHEGTEWVTVVESGDGEKAFQNARVNLSFGPRTPAGDVLLALVNALGVGLGNTQKFLRTVTVGGGRTFPQGVTLSGSVARELTDFCRSAGLEWSIQNKTVQFVDRGQALVGKAVRLSSDTGMIGSPTVDSDGLLTVSMKMIADVRLGALVSLDSSRIKGEYRVEKATWAGGTAGSEWGITVEAQRYG